MKNKLIVLSLALVSAFGALGETFSLVPVNDLRAAQSGNSITLSWTDRSIGEDRYEIEVLEKSARAATVIARIPAPANSQSFTYGPVSGPREYGFRIRPAQNLTFTAFSNYVTVKVKR